MATPPAYPPYDPTPFRDLLSVFTTALDKLDTHTTARLNRMETAMSNATKVATEALQVATSARQETKDGLERLHTGVVNAAKCSLASSERIEMILGNVNGDPDVDPEHESATVLGRIRQLERAIVELSESVSDPDAARPTVVRHETAVNTDPVERVLVDVGVSAIELELEPSVRHADVSTQVAVPAEKAPLVSPLPEPFARTSAGSQLNRGRAGTRFEVQAASAPSATQALVPAHWSSGGGCSDGPSSSDTSKPPSPSPAPIPRLNIANAPVNIPVISEGRASSVLDEQEILQSLSADVEGASRTTPSSPPPAPAPQAPPTSPAPRAVAPIPRSSTFAPSGATPRPSSPASPPTNPPTTTAQSPPKASPPIPRRTAVAALAAAAASSMASSMAMTNMAVAASMMSSPPLPAPRAVVPIPRGYGKKSATSVAATSSPSEASQPTPTRPPVTPSSSSGSLSSLSSLSSPPKSQTGTQPRPTSVAGRAQASSAASSSVPPTSSASAHVAGASTSRAGSARGRSRSTARGGKAGASASARVTVKKERSEKKPPGPPAKRRKTVGGSRPAQDDSDSDSSSDDDHEMFPVSASSRGGKGASKGARGGGRGRVPGRGGKAGGAAGGRKSKGGGTPSASGGGSKVSGKGSSTAAKAKNDPKAIGTDCRWPAKIEGDEAYQREFVQCDNCEAWYHFGCVGLKTGDPRLEPDAEFVCPPCESSDTIHKQRQGLRFQEAACMRPDCARAGRAEDTHEYFVERIIGRRPYDADVGAGVARPERFLWLVKWDGWKAESASWQERAHLGDCARFIEEFEQAAEIEGRDISKLDQVIVLNEGLAAGW